MSFISIKTESDRAAAIAQLQAAQLPAALELRDSRELRSTAQNAAYRGLIGEIAAATGHSPAAMHRHFGRRFLEFEEDQVGPFLALVPSSTRWLSKEAMSDLIAQVYATAAWLGITGIDHRMIQQIGTPRVTEMIDEDTRKKALASAIGQIETQFGKGSIMCMGAHGAAVAVETISTGSLGLDLALGIGGIPRGRVVELYGPEASGKTTLALHLVAETQKAGGTAAFIDAEHALDPVYAARLGVQVSDLMLSQPDTGEQALEITDMLVRSCAVDLVVVDSVAALTPRAEIEGEMGDSHVGLQARLMSQALRKLTANVKRSNTVILFINQIRMKIGVLFGSPETTTGGNALKFYASVRLDIRRVGAIKKGDVIIGNETKVKVVKNKLAPPFRETRFDILYGDGISREGEILDIGVSAGFVEKSGSWYSYEGVRIGQGRDNARQFLKDNQQIAQAIATQVRDRMLAKTELHKNEDGSDSTGASLNIRVA